MRNILPPRKSTTGASEAAAGSSAVALLEAAGEGGTPWTAVPLSARPLARATGGERLSALLSHHALLCEINKRVGGRQKRH